MKKTARKNLQKRRVTPFSPLALFGWIVACELAGVIGSVFTFQAIPTWYAALQKPVFNPPNWIFGPVWTLLYALMGIAAYRVWHTGYHRRAVKRAVILFLVHLAVNVLWSVLFFGAKNIPVAFADIALLWVMILSLIFRFSAVDAVSGYLLVPYLAWVSFAMVLNYYLWILNV